MRKDRSATPLTSANAESALAALEHWAAETGRALVVLVGAANAGKTVLLDVLAARLGRYFSVVYLSRSGSDPDELSARILAALGDATEGTPRLVLAREIERRRADRPLVLFLDDADILPPRVELWLFDLARRSEGALRIVLALSDARLAREFADAFRADTEIVSLDTSMAKAEAESYLRLLAARVSASNPGSSARRVDDSASARPTPAAGAPPGNQRSPADGARPPAVLAPLERPAAPSSSPPRWDLESPEQPPPPPASARVAPRVSAASSEASAREETRSPRWPWIALAAALLISFVAGFLLSELRATSMAPLVTTAEVQPAAELPSVSAPAPLESPEPPSAARSAPSTEGAVPDAPVSDVAAGRAALAARPDPFAPPVVAAALLPVDRDEPAAAPANENASAVRAPVADEERPLDAMATELAAVAGEEATAASAPAPDRENESGVAAIDDGGAALLVGADVDEPSPRAGLTGESVPGESAPDESAPDESVPDSSATEESMPEVSAPDVSAAPPARPRLVKVQVQAEPGAGIWIGDRALGTAPVGAVDLPPGAHRLVVRLPDGREVERVVEVSGGRYEIQVR